MGFLSIALLSHPETSQDARKRADRGTRTLQAAPAYPACGCPSLQIGTIRPLLSLSPWTVYCLFVQDVYNPLIAVHSYPLSRLDLLRALHAAGDTGHAELPRHDHRM